MTNPIEALNARTPIRLTVVHLCLMAGMIFTAAWGLSGSIHEVRDNLATIQRMSEEHSRRLSDISTQITQLKADRQADLDAQTARRTEWTGWRWNVGHDLDALAHNTQPKTTLWTKPNPN